MNSIVLTRDMLLAARTYLDTQLAIRFWAMLSTLLLLLFGVLFIASPSPADSFFRGVINPRMDALILKSQDLTTITAALDTVHGGNLGKTEFRLLVPVLTRIFNLSPYGMYGLQVMAGILTIYLTVIHSYAITGERALSFMVGGIVLGTHAGIMGYVELRGLFDSVPIALLLLAMYAKHPILIGLSVFLAAWGDERGLIASSLVLTFHILRDEKLISSRSIGVIVAWLAYFITRAGYAAAFDLNTATEALVFFQPNVIPLAIWSALEGGWLLVIPACVGLLRERKIIPLICFIGALAVILGVSVSLIDVTRSGAYAIPAVVVALQVLQRTETEPSRFYLIALGVGLSLLYPPYYLHGATEAFLYYPLIIYPFSILFLS